MKKCLTYLVLLLSIIIIHHEPGFAETGNDTQAWSALVTTIPLTPSRNWFGYFEAQSRIGDNVGQLERLLIRPAIGYRISPDLAISVGYGWTPTFMNNKYQSDFRDESRIWEQIAYSQHNVLDLFEITHRLREEQRFIEDAGGTQHRMRYMLKGSLPLNAERNAGLTGYNELFVGLNSVERGPRSGFDRDRFFFGPYVTLKPIRLELGYLGEYGKRYAIDTDRMLHAVALYAFIDF